VWLDVLFAYLRLVRAGFERYAAYRAASLAGMFTNTVFGLLRVSVLLAVVRHGSSVGYDAASTATYVWLGQGLLAVVALWGDGELSQRVRSGDVAIDLSLPWNLQLALLATDLGRAGNAVLIRFVPPVLIGALLFPFRWPTRPLTWALFAGSVVLAVVISAQIRFLLDLTSFWLLDSRGVRSLWNSTSIILCGLVVPLAYFPNRLHAVLALTPFPGIIQTPIDVFSERGASATALAHQFGWALLLLTCGRVALARATRRLVVQGG
jgi:ABC-2 type transport system permease protein